MPTVSTILEDVRAFYGSADLALSLNKVEITSSSEEKDATTFRTGSPASSVANTAKIVRGGLESTTLKLDGFDDYGSVATESKPNDTFFAQQGLPAALSIGAITAAAGVTCYLGNFVPTKIAKNMQPGEIDNYAVEGALDGPLIRGAYMSGVLAATDDGVGTAVQLGAIPAGKRLFAALHVLSVAGSAPTIDVKFQTDVDNTFATPTDYMSFAQVTTLPTSEWKIGTTVTTDTWWRISYNISEVGDESYLFIVTCGIE